MPTSTQRFRLVGEDDASRAFLQVAAASKLLNSNISDVNTSLFGLTKLMGGASLIPMLAGATAAVTELGTALGAAGGAAGIFGISAAGTLKGMLKARQGIATTQKSLDGLTKGTKAYHDANAKLHGQLTAFHSDYGQAAKGYDSMTSSWAKFLHATGPVTQGTLGRGFQLVADVLPKLVPVSNAAGKAVGGLIGDLSHWTEGPSFAHLLHFLETSGPKDITAFGHSIGNVLGGLGGILANFVGPGDHAAATLERLTSRFDKWGHSKGVSTSVDHFLRYVSDNGPQIDSTFSSLAQAAPKIATSLGKIGSANLTLTSKFLSLVAGLPQKQFNLIADGLFAIAAGSKAIAVVNGLAGAGGAIGAILKSKGLIGKAGGVAGAAGGFGVQKVYVVNMGAGGMGGGGGGLLRDGEKAAGGGLLVTAGTLAAAAIAAGALAYIAVKVQGGPPKQNGEGGTYQQGRPGGMSPAEWRAYNAQTNPLANAGPQIKSVGTALDSMRAKAAKASQAIEQIGPHAANMGRTAARTITALNGRANGLDAIKQHAGIATQAIDMIGPHAQQTSAKAVTAISNVASQLDHLHDRKLKITADTSQAMANLSVMRYALDALHNKTIIVRAIGGHVTDSSQVGGSSGGGASSSPGRTSVTGPNGKSMGSGAGTGPSHVPWMQGVGGPLLASIVHGIGSHWMPLGGVQGAVRSSLQAARQRLSATRASRNSFAAGFQGFATSAFGADYGTDPVTGNAIAPTISSILSHQMGQRDQAAMVKADVRKLVKLGLSPALLKQLQAAGAAGIPVIEALAGGSRSQIAQYNSLNKQTSSDLRAAGMSAGNRIWGQRLREQSRHEHELERLLKRLVALNEHGQKVEVTLNGHHLDTELAKTRKHNGGHLNSDKSK